MIGGRVIQERRWYAFQGLIQTNEWAYREMDFSSKSKQNVITFNSQGNENLRSYYSYMAIVSTIICRFSFRAKKKKHTHDSLTLMLSTFSCCSLFRNHVSLVSYSSSLSLSLGYTHSLCLSFFFISMPRHWKLLMLNVVAVLAIITGVDQYKMW